MAHAQIRVVLALSGVACSARSARPPLPSDCPPGTAPEVVRMGHGDGRFGWAQVCRKNGQNRGPFRLWIDGEVVSEGQFDRRGKPTGFWVLEQEKGKVVSTRDYGDAGVKDDGG